MAILEIIEIQPLTHPVSASLDIPGSKSITNRALILAALAQGQGTLRGALWSDDTQVMVECLNRLGFEIQSKPEEGEESNRTLSVVGKGGEVPPGGTVEAPLELFIGNAGTAARFLAAFLCLGRGVYRLSGVARMHERPQAPLFAALRALGYQVDSSNGKLPAIIHGGGPRDASCTVAISESSQFASALLLCARVGGWRIQILGHDAEESPYVTMTSNLVDVFPHMGGEFMIEPDASSGSYFLACAALNPGILGSGRGGELVEKWPQSGWQVDGKFPEIAETFQSQRGSGLSGLPSAISRAGDLGDSIMTAMILAPFSKHPIRFTDLARLRLQECDRVNAMRTELTRCGVEVLEHGDTLTVFPSEPKIHGADIETYDDHRMAMCFGVLGTKVPGMRIKDPSCVKKTFPNFFKKLAAAPPYGLGVLILDGRSGRQLSPEELLPG